MTSPTVALDALDPYEGTLGLRESPLDVLSSMFLVVGGTMDAVARWAIAMVIGRLTAVTARSLCRQSPE